MRRENHVVELEQRVVGRLWLLVEYVEAGDEQITALKAAVIACSSITGPREVFTMIADFFINASSSAPIMWRVESFRGTCSERTSEWRRSSGKRRKRTPSVSS